MSEYIKFWFAEQIVGLAIGAAFIAVVAIVMVVTKNKENK